MAEAGKLIAGVIGVVIGLIIGFGALALVMQQTGGRLFDTPSLGLLVSLGLVGGGALGMGYLALWIAGSIEHRTRKARRAQEKSRRKKK